MSSVIKLILGMLFIINTIGFTLTISDMYNKADVHTLLRSVLALTAINILVNAVLFAFFN